MIKSIKESYLERLIELGHTEEEAQSDLDALIKHIESKRMI